MRNHYLIVAIMAMAIALIAFVLVFMQQAQVNQNYEQVLIELKEIEVPELSSPQISDQSLAQGKLTLSEAIIRVTRLKGSLGSSVSGKRAAVATIEQAKRQYLSLENKIKELNSANTDFVLALTNMQSQYEVKIAVLEERLSKAKKSKKGLSLEFMLGLMGILTGFSSLVLAWKKDNREMQKLKLEIEKLRAA